MYYLGLVIGYSPMTPAQMCEFSLSCSVRYISLCNSSLIRLAKYKEKFFCTTSSSSPPFLLPKRYLSIKASSIWSKWPLSKIYMRILLLLIIQILPLLKSLKYQFKQIPKINLSKLKIFLLFKPLFHLQINHLLLSLTKIVIWYRKISYSTLWLQMG